MKIYKVEFNQYTNGMHDTVSNGAKEFKDQKYLRVNKYNFLVKESDLEYYRQFGDGFQKVELVGELQEVNQEKPIGIVIRTELKGLEEANVLAEKLKNTLDNLKVKLILD